MKPLLYSAESRYADVVSYVCLRTVVVVKNYFENTGDLKCRRTGVMAQGGAFVSQVGGFGISLQ